MLSFEEYKNKVEFFKLRIGMFIGDPTYDRTCSFLIGMDYGLDGSVNSEFGKWLCQKYKINSPYWWSDIIRILISERNSDKIISEADKIDYLFRELNEFLCADRGDVS